ncbi:zinc-ribbon domain-containing protein [Buttiauxella sp. S19-1]|uniref:zinc-ribbon domain-containing protein n=1 Tax=Buttiauxella sp. S19-1 TaxID=941430 RepID=UPI001EDC4557|nr:zinc-ribbon domain-containing protein [Buttiauxella sp. S19-1]
MRIRKAFMALNTDGHIVRAADVTPGSTALLTCHHCDCPMRFHRTAGGQQAWFEHDTPVLTQAQLQKCAYFDDLSLTERRQLALQRQLQKLRPVEVVRHWHCIECDHDYSGRKYCPKCYLSIYSREVHAD